MFAIYPLISDYYHISPVWYQCAILYKYLSCLVLTCQDAKQWQDLTGHTRVPQILWWIIFHLLDGPSWELAHKYSMQLCHVWLSYAKKCFSFFCSATPLLQLLHDIWPSATPMPTTELWQLWCLVEGEAAANLFQVVANIGESMYQLKKLIQGEKKISLWHEYIMSCPVEGKNGLMANLYIPLTPCSLSIL